MACRGTPTLAHFLHFGLAVLRSVRRKIDRILIEFSEEVFGAAGGHLTQLEMALVGVNTNWILEPASNSNRTGNHLGLQPHTFAQNAELQAAANLLIVVRGAETIHSRQGLTPTESAVLDEIVALCETHGLWGKVSAFSLESQSELAAAYRHLVARRSVFALRPIALDRLGFFPSLRQFVDAVCAVGVDVNHLLLHRATTPHLLDWLRR